MDDLDQIMQSLPSDRSGESVGVLIDGHFWYWEEQTSTIEITARKIRDRLNRIITLLGWFVGYVLLLGFFALLYLQYLTDIFTVDFWKQDRPIYSMFFLSGLVLMFAWYRSKEKKIRIKGMPSITKGQKATVSKVASLSRVERKENIAIVLNKDARVAIDNAFHYAYSSGQKDVTPVHVFLGMIGSRSIRLLFMRLGITFEKMADPIKRHIAKLEKGETRIGSETEEMIVLAFANAVNEKRSELSAIELFSQAYEKSEFLAELFFSLDVEEDELRNTVEWMRIDEMLLERYERYREAAAFKSTGTMNRAYTALATPFLDRVSEDLTVAAAKGVLPFLIGREKEMNEMLRVIEGGGKSTLLIGPSGVGKGALIAGLAERMVEENVPEVLQDKRLVKISIPHIVSGGEGTAEERLLYVLREVGQSGNIILVIEGIEQLALQSGLISVLVTELEKRYTFVIATTTPQAFTQVIEKTSLLTVFSSLRVAEPKRKDAIKVLGSRIGGIESQNKVIFTYEALAALIDMSMRFMHDSFLPDKAIILAQEVGLSKGKGGEDWQMVTEQDVAKIVSEKTNIPLADMTKDEKSKLLNLEEEMHKRMVGQDDAVAAVASALRRARTQLRSTNRPIANFLFLGSTGVGKTELAKTTAATYFNNEEAMIRFDMSEYQDKGSIERLIGGTNQAGQLTEAVRKAPFSLVLLDELEKAHPDILNLFLQVMDDGRLTDGTGRTIDFTNIILIATSNAGTAYIQDEVAKGTDIDVIKNALMENQLRKVYRPEFLNRFDGVMVFKPLSEEDVIAIAYLMIQKTVHRLEKQGIHFKATDEAVHELAKKGYDPKYGARPLRRVIQEEVDNAIADFLLKGEVGRRDTLILQTDGQITVEKASKL